METANGNTVTGHAETADRILIRPASGRQAGTGLLTRTYLAKDIRKSEVTFATSHKQRAPAPP
jgi:hypothetical protein